MAYLVSAGVCGQRLRVRGEASAGSPGGNLYYDTERYVYGMASGIPGYYETHSANDVVWRTAPVARLFFDEELVSLLVKAFNLGAWGRVDNGRYRQNRRSVLNREGDLEGRYYIGKKLIIVTSDHPYGKPTVKDEADALADPRALDQPARAASVL